MSPVDKSQEWEIFDASQQSSRLIPDKRSVSGKKDGTIFLEAVRIENFASNLVDFLTESWDGNNMRCAF